MTPRENRELARLLKKIPKEKYWIPEEAFEALHGTVSMWAPELVIMRSRNREILLTPYHGRFSHGSWHIPGGYNLWNETIQETVSRVAKRELGVDVTYTKTLDIYKWRKGEHPYGRPLSLYVLCKPKSRIEETAEKKFFPIDRLPHPMISPHRRFIEKHFSSRP